MRPLRPGRRSARYVLVAAVLATAVVVGVVVLRGRPPRHRPHRVPPAAAPTPARKPVTPRANEAERERRVVARLIGEGYPVFCGARRGRDVALTFDDGPGVYTSLALRILTRAHARATFFLVGRNLARWSWAPRRELRLGALGDHTWTHPYLPSLSRAAVEHELADTQRAIRAATREPVRLFRPPYGATDAVVSRIARRHGLLQVLWSVDSGDWAGANWRQIARNVLSRARPGAIVLLHENRGQTDRALRYLLLPGLRKRGLRTVSVPRLLASDPPTRAQLRKGIAGCGGEVRR